MIAKIMRKVDLKECIIAIIPTQISTTLQFVTSIATKG